MYKIKAERPRPPFLSNAKYAPLVIFSFVFLTLLSMSCLNNESEGRNRPNNYVMSYSQNGWFGWYRLFSGWTNLTALKTGLTLSEKTIHSQFVPCYFVLCRVSSNKYICWLTTVFKVIKYISKVNDFFVFNNL